MLWSLELRIIIYEWQSTSYPDVVCHSKNCVEVVKRNLSPGLLEASVLSSEWQIINLMNK